LLRAPFLRLLPTLLLVALSLEPGFFALAFLQGRS
jgi:hypothetical protein